MRRIIKHYDPKDLERLSNNPAFQRAYASDPQLDELERMAASADFDAKKELLTFFGGNWLICGTMEVRPITAGVASLLWLIDSPYICRRDTLNRDVDAALCVVAERLDALSSGDVFEYSLGYCERNGLDRREVDAQLREAVSLCVHPFTVFPPPADKEEMKFDCEWLGSLVRKANAVAGLTPDQAIWETPLMSVGYYVVEYHRSQGEKLVRVPKKEILDSIFDRTYEMVDEWLAKGA